MTDRSRGQRPHDDLKIVFLPISSLQANPRNARTHSRRQIRQIADSIAAFGFNNPVLIDENSHIIAGHGRVEGETGPVIPCPFCPRAERPHSL